MSPSPAPVVVTRADEHRIGRGVIRRRDLRRCQLHAAAMATGLDEVPAWRHVLETAPGCVKLLAWLTKRGGGALTDELVAESFAKHCSIVAPAEIEQTKAVVRGRLRRTAVKGAQLVDDFVSGEFGEAKVTRNGERVSVEVDASTARVQLDAAKLALQVATVIEPPGPKTQVNVQTNVNTTAEAATARETARAIARDPEALRLARELEERLAAPPA